MSWYFYPDNFPSYEDYVQYLKEKKFALEAPTEVAIKCFLKNLI